MSVTKFNDNDNYGSLRHGAKQSKNQNYLKSKNLAGDASSPSLSHNLNQNRELPLR